MQLRAAALTVSLLAPAAWAPAQEPPAAAVHAPIRAVTRGPSLHWFGYYDVAQFDPSGRYLLGCEVDFEHRSPRPDDVIRVGMIDLHDGDRWTQLGTSRAWGWQQGCRLQWRPGSDREVLWNDREGDRFVCRILDVRSGALRTLPHPVYHVSPDGRTALGTDFARIQHMRPGYGYAGVPDPHRDEPAPTGSGIYRLDLDTGEHTSLFSIAEIAARPYPDPRPGDRHYFNHLEWNPDGSRFLFLHRWRPQDGGGFRTRMLTADAQGGDLRVVTDRPGISHYTWRDPQHVLVHRGAYRLYTDDGSGREATVLEAPNGHQSYLPGGEWLITDTYPRGPQRLQELYLFHLPTRTKVTIGEFASPPEYRGEWRVDTHPRVSPDGTQVVIDSAHGGDGRQMYLIDIAALLAPPPAWQPPQDAPATPFALDSADRRYRVWGRRDDEPRAYFDEHLPALFERTLVLDGLGDAQRLEWILTGPRGGVTVEITRDELRLTERHYDSQAFTAITETTARHPEWRAPAAVVALDRAPRGVGLTLDAALGLTLAVDGAPALRRSCLLDLARHQLRLHGEGALRGRMLRPAAAPARIRVLPESTHQTMIGFGGIATPTAYAQLGAAGKRRFWRWLCEYNLLIQREYPIGTRLSPALDNWDRLADATPHYYGDNFPNGEISDFAYQRTLRRLGGQVWFEFWQLPPWVGDDAEAYARAVLGYCRTARQQAGHPPEVVGIQNEVDQPAERFQRMTLALREALDREGFADVAIHTSDASTLRGGIERIAKFRTDPATWAAIDYAATHMYDYQRSFTDPDAFDASLRRWRELAGDKPFLSTELCVNDSRYQSPAYRVALAMGQLYHKNLALADAAALCYCWTLLHVQQPSYGATRALLVVDPAHGFEPVPSSHQLRVFGAYSRRVRAGMRRVAVECDQPDLLVTAFCDQGGATLVALNRATRPLELRIDWPGAALTQLELTSPYHPNLAAPLELPLTLAPGAVATIGNVPPNRLPDGFEVE